MNRGKFIKPIPIGVKLYGGKIIYVACTEVMMANYARMLPYVMAVYATAGNETSTTNGCQR